MPTDCPTYLRQRGTEHIRRSGRAARDHVVTIVDAQWVSTGLRRLTFHCDGLDGAWLIGDRLLVRVSGDCRRYYTIAGINRARGLFDVLAVAHPHGAGGRWAGTAEAGDTTVVFGPKPDLDVRIDGARQAILLGDETTVGLFQAIRSGRQRSIPVRGAVEHGTDIALNATRGALEGIDILPRDDAAPGAGLHAWVRTNVGRESGTVFFVNGHGAAVRALRLTLLSIGVKGAAIRSRAYWGRG